MHKLEKPQVQWEFLLGYAPMRTPLAPQERPEPVPGIHMDFTQAVAIVIGSELVLAMVHTLMVVSARL